MPTTNVTPDRAIDRLSPLASQAERDAALVEYTTTLEARILDALRDGPLSPLELSQDPVRFTRHAHLLSRVTARMVTSGRIRVTRSRHLTLP